MKRMIELDSKETLREVIRRGDDGFTNTLVITEEGHFLLVPWHGVQRADWETSCVVKMNTFAAGNDNVGSDAAADDSVQDPERKRLAELKARFTPAQRAVVDEIQRLQAGVDNRK